jgi:hypothetical protein
MTLDNRRDIVIVKPIKLLVLRCHSFFFCHFMLFLFDSLSELINFTPGLVCQIVLKVCIPTIRINFVDILEPAKRGVVLSLDINGTTVQHQLESVSL